MRIFFAESLDAIAPIDLSLRILRSLADPAVSAEIIVLNLFFNDNFLTLIYCLCMTSYIFNILNFSSFFY